MHRTLTPDGKRKPYYVLMKNDFVIGGVKQIKWYDVYYLCIPNNKNDDRFLKASCLCYMSTCIWKANTENTRQLWIKYSNCEMVYDTTFICII